MSTPVDAAAIDIVFLWVDGGDPEFAALKRKYLTNDLAGRGPDDELVGDHARYFQMEEIVYAVRSVRLFAPWIRTIHIVVADGQQLPVSVLAVPNVRVVRHSEIIPAAWLPTFCSPSIEPFVHRIPGLSELFIYGNDDFMFWNDTPLSYFIEDGQLILRGSYMPKHAAQRNARSRGGHPRISGRTAMLLYGHGFERVYMPEHAFEIFRKSTCSEAWNEFEPAMSEAVALKFRDDDRSLFWRMIVNAVEARRHRPIRKHSWNGCDIPLARVESNWIVARYVEVRLAILKRSRREVACLNTIPPGWYNRMRRYLDAHYDKAERRKTPSALLTGGPAADDLADKESADA